MNDSVLRGFCQKCEWPISTMKIGENEYEATHIPLINEKTEISMLPTYHEIKPVWFLSPNQIKILFEAHLPSKDGRNVIETVYWTLEHEPFLVARILSESEEK